MLDVLNADHQLSLFLARAIVDEVLPPAFLTAALPFLENQSQGVNIVQATGTPLAFPSLEKDFPTVMLMGRMPLLEG